MLLPAAINITVWSSWFLVLVFLVVMLVLVLVPDVPVRGSDFSAAAAAGGGVMHMFNTI